VSTRLFSIGFARFKAGEARFLVENLLILFVIILLLLILVSVELPIHVSVDLCRLGTNLSIVWTSPVRTIEPNISSCATDNFDMLLAGTSQMVLSLCAFLFWINPC
jgi:hypothetical protein